MCRFFIALAAGLVALVPLLSAQAEDFPLIDGHIHYSHDNWEILPPDQAIAILRKAGLKKAIVSSSSDEGTQMLYAIAPELIVPVLRPYRKRGETGTWFTDGTVPGMMRERLAKYRYAGLGEFHIDGIEAETEVMRAVVQLAKKHGLFLHSHSDAAAVHEIFEQDPEALVLWAHAGFEPLEVVRETIARYKNLWADLSFRTPNDGNGKVKPQWRKLLSDYPDRFILGTDTYTPSRWSYVTVYAGESRVWLKDLPEDLARNLAYRNAEALLKRVGWE